MLALGLLPLLCWGLASHQLTSRVLSLRSTQIEDLLARVDSRLGATPSDQELREELSAARLYLLQAELARRSLARLLPRTLLLTLLGSTLLIALAAFVLGRQLARPIEALAAGMNRYARGDLGHRLPVANDAVLGAFVLTLAGLFSARLLRSLDDKGESAEFASLLHQFGVDFQTPSQAAKAKGILQEMNPSAEMPKKADVSAAPARSPYAGC